MTDKVIEKEEVEAFEGGMNEPLNEQPAKPRNRRERQAQKYAGKLGEFNLASNSQIKNGYVAGTERSCTNCFWLIVFVLYLAACLGIAVTGIVKGNFTQLVAGVDTDGRVCGQGAVADYPNFYYLATPSPTPTHFYGMCVKTCPATAGATIDCATTTKVPECQPADSLGYGTTDILGLCTPNPNAAPELLQGPIAALTQNQWLTAFWKDMQIASLAIYICLGLGLVYTFIYLYLMSNCAHMLSYLAIGLLELIWLAGMGGCAYAATRPCPSGVQCSNSSIWIAFVVCAVAFCIFNCMLWCFWSKLQVAIAVIDATADYMAGTKRIALVSVYYFLLALIVLLLGGFGIVGTVAMNEIKVNREEGCSESSADCTYTKEIVFTGQTEAMLAVSCIGLFWVLCYIGEKNKLIYMIGAAQFYFSSDKNKTGSAGVISAMAIANFKHAGSVALGSLIHTLIAILRAIVDAMVDAANRKTENAFVMIIGCLLKCCMACIEGWIEWLNTVAYAYMAISGDPYCKSAWNGFMLSLKHLVKFYFADTLATMFVWIGILSITALNTGTCFLIMKYGTKNSDQLSSVWVPLVLILVATLITASLFIGFFSVAVKGTLMCMAVDVELNGEVKFGTPSFHEKMKNALGDSFGAQQAEIHIGGNNGGYQQPPQQHMVAGNQVYNGNQGNQNQMV